jgi:hypothetical protein
VSGYYIDGGREGEMDDLIELANARSRITGENAAEEYLRLLLRLGMAEEVEPTKAPQRCP